MPSTCLGKDYLTLLISRITKKKLLSLLQSRKSFSIFFPPHITWNRPPTLYSAIYKFHQHKRSHHPEWISEESHPSTMKSFNFKKYNTFWRTQEFHRSKRTQKIRIGNPIETGKIENVEKKNNCKSNDQF